MYLQRRDPFADLYRTRGLAFQPWHALFDSYDPGETARAWRIPLDIRSEGDSLVVAASLPGLKADEIEVQVDEGVLSISAETKTGNDEEQNGYLRRERRSGRFQRAVRLPENVDGEQAASRYEDGVLTITLPRVEAKKAKQIEVKAA